MALIFVLSSLLVIAAVATEIAFSSHVVYHLASYRRDEIQARWLLRSSVAFGRILLKYDKEIRDQFASLGSLPGVTANSPFCAQAPFSTMLLRALFQTEEEGAPKTETKGGGEKEAKEEGLELESVGILASKEAADFLSFKGDFSLECADEQAKFNVNYFFEAPPPATPQSTLYDNHKSLLASILGGSSFKDFFKDPREPSDLAGRLADWVDRDESINDYGGVVRGYEESVYTAEYDYRPKNGKFSSLEELHLVAGMTDTIFERLAPQVTLYGDNKVNVCLASSDVVSGLVVEFSRTSGRTTPVAPDNKEILDEIALAVKKECEGANPTPDQIGRKVEELLGAGARPPLATSSGAASAPAGFSSLITTKSRFLSLKLDAQVGDTELKGEVVLDTEGQANRWKTLYSRVY